RVLRDKGVDLIEADSEQLGRIVEQAGQISSEQLTYYIEELAKLEAKLKSVTQKRVILEVGLIRLLRQEETPTVVKNVPVKEIVHEVVREVPKQQNLQRSVQREDVKPEAAPRVQDHSGTITASANMTPGANTAKVIAKWPEVRKKIIMQWQSLYTLNFMRLEPGRSDDELVLKSSKGIYCTQLEMKDGEKLKLIADQIQEATGVRVRLRAVSEERQKVQSADLSDIMNQVHTDVNWRN
ncbi:MAG: hypothetical protein IJN87_09605, partial [Firmicutes bacterium]|nr:hypothetical protein [Bacillota bacterium]